MLVKIILLIQAFSFISTLKSIRLKEIETLVERFESQLDTNYLFYDKVHSQKNHPLICDAAYGPKCLLINNDSLLDSITEDDSIETLTKKAKIIQEWEHIRDQVKAAPEGTFYVITNHLKDNIMGRTKIIPPQTVEALIDFEAINLDEKEELVSGSLVYEFEKKFTFEAETTSSKLQKDLPNTVRISFENLFIPETKLVYNKKGIFDNQGYLDNHKETPLEDLEPSLVYLFTKKDTGIIHFSKPIVVSHVYLKKHNFVTYVNERNAQGKDKKIVEHHITGQFQNLDAVVFEKATYIDYNQWIKVTPNREGVMIDSLVIGPNMDIDNIYFTMPKEKGITKLTNNDFQEMFAYVLGKVAHFSQITDVNKKIDLLKDDLRTYLIKRGISPDTINHILENFQLTDTGNGQYEITIDKNLEFLDTNFNNIDLSQISILPLEDLKDIDMETLKQEFEKKGFELNDENMKEIEKVLEKVKDMVKTNDKKTEEKKDSKNKENQKGKTI